LSSDTINNVHFTTAILLQAVFRTHSQFVFILHHLFQEWTKLDKPNGAPWPKERAAHAACCLNYGQDHPQQVLVTGGHDNNGNTLKDMWILDVKSGRWKEVSDEVHRNVWLAQSQHCSTVHRPSQSRTLTRPLFMTMEPTYLKTGLAIINI